MSYLATTFSTSCTAGSSCPFFETGTARATGVVVLGLEGRHVTRCPTPGGEGGHLLHGVRVEASDGAVQRYAAKQLNAGHHA